jgi:hypothetical protein
MFRELGNFDMCRDLKLLLTTVKSTVKLSSFILFTSPFLFKLGVKIFLYLINHQSMKTYGSVEV